MIGQLHCLGLSGDVHFDDAEQFTINIPTGRNLLWVAVHEIGHSIGLEHSNVRSAIMYPWYRGNEGKDFDLDADDKLGIQNIYGMVFFFLFFLLNSNLFFVDLGIFQVIL